MARILYRLLPPSMFLIIYNVEPDILIFLNRRYWKKILNYIFGGFNFLMWIAFIVTIVCASINFPNGDAESCHSVVVL